MSNFSFPVRDGKNRERKKKNQNSIEGDYSTEKDGCCDFEEFLLQNKMYPNYSRNPEDYEQDECEFQNVPLDESEYENEKEFLHKNEKVYFVFKPSFSPYMAGAVLPMAVSFPITLLLSVVFGYVSIGSIIWKSWFGLICFIPFIVVALLTLYQAYWFFSATFSYRNTKYLVTSKRVLWIRGFLKRKCNKLTYRQINSITTSSCTKSTQKINFYTELSPLSKYGILMYGVPNDLNLGNKIIAVTKAVLLKKKPNFNFTSAPTTEESDLDDTAEGNSLSNS